jgi:hypothetical protein
MQYYAEKVTEFTLQEARRAQANQEFVQALRRVRKGERTALGRWITRLSPMRPRAATRALPTPPIGRWSW